MPKISFILPSLNVVDYIEKCISSVLLQTEKDIEVICIDAGSDDGTLDILRRYEVEDSRVRIIISPVKSYGYQVNLGIKNASGEYLGIVETDDYIESDMSEKLLDAADKYHPDAVKCNAMSFKELDGTISGREIRYLGSEHLYNRLLTGDEVLQLRCLDYNIWNGIYRLDFLRKNHIFCNETRGAAFQDIGFLQRMYSSLKSIFFLDESLYVYRLDRDESSSYSPRCLINACSEYKSILEECYLSDFDESVVGNKSDSVIMNEHLPFIAIKMADSFLVEYSKVLFMEKYDFQSLFLTEPYKWFKEQLTKFIDKKILTEKLLGRNRWVMLCFLLKSESSYTVYKKIEDTEPAVNEELRRMVLGRKVVIFGSGTWGKCLRDMLFDLGIAIDCIADNMESKWHEKTEFTPAVMSPEKAYKLYPNDVYVIANKNYYREMEEQLKIIGINSKNIFVWNR